MSTFEVTTADAVREAIANAISSIVPRYEPRRDERFTWLRDQEIAAGSTFRSFDVVLAPERETIGGMYGGGIEYESDVEIRVSYPAGEPDAMRFAGSDGQDFAARLVRLHQTTTGMFPISASGPRSVVEGPELEGESGRHVAIFRTVVHFFVSDTVTTG